MNWRFVFVSGLIGAIAALFGMLLSKLVVTRDEKKTKSIRQMIVTMSSWGHERISVFPQTDLR